jgi:protoporphyrinogen oxidase
MSRERVLIVGGGVSGLAAAGFLADRFDCLLVEREPEVGGYCRTIYKDGFTWDYSGHFFHFRHKWIADYVHARMDLSALLTVDRKSRIYFRNGYINFPFQFNIHELPLVDFVHCLADMYEAQQQVCCDSQSFRDMVYGRYGRTLSELFLIPYNEKLYSVEADQLDANAMGRFFPHIEFADLLKRIRSSLQESAAGAETYNTHFCYHKAGAKAYVNALASYIPDGVVRVSSACEAIDTTRKRAKVAGEQISYDRLIISAPLPSILHLVGRPAPPEILTANKVLVFNLGFDRKSNRPDHWVYYPERDWVFFRIGHYDNILGQDRMSLYVEVAMPQQTEIDIDKLLTTVLAHLERAGVVDGHQLVSSAAVILDPAYVHVTMNGQQFVAESQKSLRDQDIFPIGRYGRWTYCSIEDNIVEAYRLARDWGSQTDLNELQSGAICDPHSSSI